MPHVAARVTTAIPAVGGLQPDGGLGALTPRTEGTRIGPRSITVVRLMHSCVPSCSHVRLRRSARVARRRSTGPVRRLNACCSFGLKGQARSHVRQCQQRVTAPCQMLTAATTVPPEWQKTHRRGTEDHIVIFRMAPVWVLLHSRAKPVERGHAGAGAHTCRRRSGPPEDTIRRFERMAVTSQGADQPGDRSLMAKNVRENLRHETDASTTGAFAV